METETPKQTDDLPTTPIVTPLGPLDQDGEPLADSSGTHLFERYPNVPKILDTFGNKLARLLAFVLVDVLP